MANTYTYLAVVYKDHDSDYGVSFPSLPGCVTAGRTREEAFINAEEALAFHIEGLLSAGMVVQQNPKEDNISTDGAVLFKIRVVV